MMIDREMTAAQLKDKAGFSANIIARLKKMNIFLWKALKNL